MAEYAFKGLTGLLGTVTVADPTTATIDDVIATIAAEEGLPAQYYGVSVDGNPSINDIAYGDSTTPIGTGGLEITVTDRFICTTKQTGLTKEERQIQKLDIAQRKRTGGLAGDSTQGDYYRLLNTYDRDRLPTKYTGNTVTDNPNPGGLQPGRPWT